MPELPEVQTIVNILRDGGRDQPGIVGERVKNAKVYWHKTVEQPSPKQFETRILGQTVKDVGRRGKYICIQLSQDVMLIHLRMSGDLLVGRSNAPLGSHSRLAVYFDSGWQLSFNNPRKFGRVWLVKDAQQVLFKLGPEPLDKSLTFNMFYNQLQSHKRQIKPLLLDQSFIAGVGNIYADEALHLAKINPLMISNQIEQSRAKKLLSSLRKVLKEGIKRNGASIDWVYQGGGFQNYFRVYQRTDEPCHSCGSPISRIVVGQRGTHYCPSCQPLPLVGE